MTDASKPHLDLLAEGKRIAGWAPEKPESVHEVLCCAFNQLDAQYAALQAAISLIQDERDSLEEQLEAARTHRIYKRMVEMEEQLVAARHERSVACDWAAELAGEKRALQASVEIIQQERDALLASVRDHCSRPPGVCYPASAPDVDGLPCRGTGAEYLVEQDNSNPASVGSSDEAGGAPTSPATYPASEPKEG
jgi:hypothetical protein